MKTILQLNIPKISDTGVALNIYMDINTSMSPGHACFHCLFLFKIMLRNEF